jgi:hypothetical protein
MLEIIGIIIFSLIMSVPFIVWLQAHIEKHCDKEMDEMANQH